MAKLFFYIVNGVKQDAVSEEELIRLAKSGVIGRDTQIWCQGYSDWITLAESEIDTSFLPPPVIKPTNVAYPFSEADYPKAITDIKEMFDKYFIEHIKNIFNYKGRTSRRSFWFFMLFNLIAIIITFLIAYVIPIFGFIFSIYIIASIIVQFSLIARRLHDVGHSGWWILAPIVPFIFCIQPSQLTENEYGSVPEY